MDYHKTDEHVPINIDVTLFNAPCSVVSIDYRDMMGQDIHDISVKKTFIDNDGKESDVNFLILYPYFLEKICENDRFERN